MVAYYAPSQCVAGQKNGGLSADKDLTRVTYVFDTSMLFYCTGLFEVSLEDHPEIPAGAELCYSHS